MSAIKVSGGFSERIGNAKKYFYHTDHLGSVKVVTNGDGVKVWEADYYSFGRQFARNKVDPTFEEDDLGFTGKGYDADIGLYYFNARWYDPDLGRFISEDPAADPNNPNLYTYCANNPVMYTDPSGKYIWAIIGVFLWNWGDKASQFANKYAPGHWMDGFMYGLFGAPTFTFGGNIYWQ